MDQFIVDQLKSSLRLIPKGLIKSCFSSENRETRAFIEKHGFIGGVCHPTENFDQLKAANIKWVRNDIPYPFDADGKVSESYTAYKERALRFAQHGIKTMAVTPYPRHFIEAGLDPRDRKNERGIKEVARFLAKDLQGVVGAFQITNEMGLPHFTIPLNLRQAARFIGIQAMAMFNCKGDIIVGYNSAGPQADLHELLLPYMNYFDYVGLDLYIGCFREMPGFMFFFGAVLRYLWGITKKPIMLQEFGYIGDGEPKSKEQKQEILRGYGFADEQSAIADIAGFLAALPKDLAHYIHELFPDDEKKRKSVFANSDIPNHLYKQLPPITKIPGYPHTPQGQAKFFRDMFERFKKMPFLCGAFVYCYKDSEQCYICSQSDCPVETRWGLVDLEEHEKPSYYVVGKAFGERMNNNS